MPDVLCLRPEEDFTKVGVTPPGGLNITYTSPGDARLAALMQAAKALVIPAVGPKLAPALFEGSRLKLVQVTGAGVDRVDIGDLAGRGIPVANIPGGSNEAIAEYAVSCTGVLLRRMVESSTAIRQGDYVEFRKRLLATGANDLRGLVVGVIGLGTIGRAVAEGFKRAGARLVYHDPALTDLSVAEALGAEQRALDALMQESDVVTLHVPLLPATEGLIGGARLAMMKPGAILIQASRGGIVDEAALAAALESGRLAGAAVDVYSTEPPSPDNPLLTLSEAAAARTILTPHIAGVSRQSWATLFQRSWDNVAAVLLQGQTPQHVVRPG